MVKNVLNFRHFTRIEVKGKFLYEGINKFYIKGVTYGTFAPGENNHQFPAADIVEKDFAMMEQHGINSVRTYTVPPIWLLDIAQKHDLRVMIGLPWEQHITFLDSEKRKKEIAARMKKEVESCNNHPSVLCYTIGNEIPSQIVRWFGKRKIELFLKSLYTSVKEADPAGLVTYVNYPTTEYLDLSFLDFNSFNVYLETPEKLNGYLSRLHNLFGDKPLLMAEIGLDSTRNGLQKQAEVMTWQIETVFGKGCAGMFVFAWTDEWWRGGFEIEDWNFGLTDRDRNPKPVLSYVSAAMKEIPVFFKKPPPFFSVVVCTYNGAATIKDCMEELMKMTYPNFEVIVINDGSKDNTAQIVSDYPVRAITTSNHGLGNARNTGMYKAKGDIIAYIDDDAYPDPHWLHYLAYAYSHSTHAAIGGPNIIPHENGPVAICVANAPGGPVHVLETDELAEHIPGCNFSVKRNVLMSIGGFDPVFRTAGDDVDVCWRIQEAGFTVGYHPSATVWHHRRNSVKAYWKQQKGYGKAEALLEAKWPEKYNGLGHLAWAGRIYGNGFTLPIQIKRGKIFHGTWGMALFQSVYEPANGIFNSIPLMPEWYLFTLLTGLLAFMGVMWQPLLWLLPVFIFSVAVIFIQATISAHENTSLTKSQEKNRKYNFLIILLHLIQPLARLKGRLSYGLTPWRLRGAGATFSNPVVLKKKILKYWSEQWKSPETWLEEIEQNLILLKTRVKRGGNFDRWDLQIKNGLFTKIKILLTTEDHGANKQYVKIKWWPVYSKSGLALIIFVLALGFYSASDNRFFVSAVISLISCLIVIKYLSDTVNIINSLKKGFNMLDPAVIRKSVNVEVINRKVNDKPAIFDERQTDVQQVVTENNML